MIESVSIRRADKADIPAIVVIQAARNTVTNWNWGSIFELVLDSSGIIFRIAKDLKPFSGPKLG